MKKFYNNWQKLNWFGRILSIPGLLVIGVVMLIISPIIIVCMAIGYTMDVLGVSSEDLFDGGSGYEP